MFKLIANLSVEYCEQVRILMSGAHGHKLEAAFEYVDNPAKVTLPALSGSKVCKYPIR